MKITEKKLKILVIGEARHGKDTVAEMMNHHYGITYTSSSQAALDIFLFDVLNEKYNLKYKNKKEAFADRVNHRDKWYNEIERYNKYDKTFLAKEILKTNDIYVGMRSEKELKECIKQKVFDVIIGVYDYRKSKEDKSSNTINIFKYADFIICNNSSLKDLDKRVAGKLDKFKQINNLK